MAKRRRALLKQTCYYDDEEALRIQRLESRWLTAEVAVKLGNEVIYGRSACSGISFISISHNSQRLSDLHCQGAAKARERA